MRNRYVVAYDIADPKRRRRIFRAMNGFGDAIQYSVFICDLSGVERDLLEQKLSQLMLLSDDRAMIVDLGPADGRGLAAIEFIGPSLSVHVAEYMAVII